MRMMEEEQLGWNYDEANIPNLHRMGSMTAGRAYYRARVGSMRGESVIPYNPDLDRELDESVGRFVKTELASVSAFHADMRGYLTAIQARPEAERPWVDLSITETIRGPLVSDTLVSGYRAKVRAFHQETQRCFDPAAAAGAGCAEMK
jgi:hypothetical protein